MTCSPLSSEASTPLPARRGNRAVIEGFVVRDGELLPGAYVRLLDAGGELVAEVQTDWAGAFLSSPPSATGRCARCRREPT